MPRGEKLTEKQLVNRIAAYVEKGINSEDGDVTHVRQLMFERYYGEQFGHEREGFSTYVSREVLEAIEWALPAIMRIFIGGQKAVEFSASGPDDESQAEHETDVVNHWFYDGNDEFSGFLTLYSWIKDLLMYPNGYVTVGVVEEDEEIHQEFTGISQEQIRTITEVDETAEVKVIKTYTGPEGQISDIEVTRTELRRTIEVTPVPPDEVIIAHGHTKLDVDKAPFVCIRTKYTRDELVDMGYTHDELDEVQASQKNLDWNTERLTRLFYVEEDSSAPDDDNDLGDSDHFWYHDCYMRIDWDDDGKAELRRVVMIGSNIFENEPIEFNPIVAGAAIHIPHKHIGMSYAEIVSDLQLLMSTLTRQLLDNVYKQNVRRTFINERAILPDNSTMDQLLDGASEVIETRGPPGENVMPEIVQPIVTDIMQAIQMLDSKSELRTGVAPNITLDPDTLKESTMGAFVGALEQASQRLELLARLFAETGLKRVFQKIHYLLRTYFDGVQHVKVNDKWVQYQPSKWRKRSNMAVNVGLGFNNKQVMMMLLMQILQIQREAVPAGLADQKKVFNTLKKLIEQANIGHAGSYFLDPNGDDWKEPPPKPDPAMISAQAQAKSLEADAKRRDKELEHKMQMEQLDRQIKREEIEMRASELMHRLEELSQNRLKLEGDLALKDAQITELNARAKKNAEEPYPESSADDEFSRAETRVKKAANGKGDKDDEGASSETTKG